MPPGFVCPNAVIADNRINARGTDFRMTPPSRTNAQFHHVLTPSTGKKSREMKLSSRRVQGSNQYLPSVLRIRFVRKAVQPAFPGFGRGDNGMSAGSGVLAGVPVGRRVAAECDSAGL